jgi:3-hydroxyisobutyrate dehydrogenase
VEQCGVPDTHNELNVSGQLQTVAFLGVGLMGAPMVRRLLAAGFIVRVWNRTAAKLDELVAAGATPAASPAEACEGAQVACVCVSNAGVVEEVVFGDRGAATAQRAPATLIDFSTIGPEATREFADRLRQTAGTAWLDAPVSGGPRGAASGKLVIFCGGEDTRVASMQPLFAALSQRVTHFGPVGTGQAAKIANQIIVSITLSAIAEALALAERMSLDPRRLVEALTGGYADSIPLQIFGRRMAERSFEPKLGEISLMAKDLALAAQLAKTHRVELPVLDAALAFYESALASGYATKDLGTLIELHDAGTLRR